MLKLLLNSFRSIKKRLLQYLGLFILLTLSLSIFSALLLNTNQIITKNNILQNNPHRANYYIGNWNWNGLKLLDDTADSIDNPDDSNNNVNLIKKLITIKEKNELKKIAIKNWTQDDIAIKERIDELLLEIYKIFIFQKPFSIFKQNNEHNALKAWRILEVINNSTEINMRSSLIPQGFYTDNENKQNFKFVVQFNTNSEKCKKKTKHTSELINTNDVILTTGRYPCKKEEIVISESYALNNKKKIGDTINIKNLELKIVGIGNGSNTKILISENNLTDVFWKPLDPQNNGVIFITTDLLFENELKIFNDHVIGINLQGNVSKAEAYIKEKLYEKILTEKHPYTLIQQYKDNIQSNVVIQTIIYISITILSIFGLLIICVFFIQKEIFLQRSQIGNLKAFGYNSWKIAFNFVGIIFILNILASAFGFGISLLFQNTFSSAPRMIYNIGLNWFYYDWLISIIFFILLPIMFTIICYFLIAFLLRTSVLQLIYPKPKNKTFMLIYYIKMLFKSTHFYIRLSVAFFCQSFSKWLISSIILLIVSFLLSFQYLIFDSFNQKVNTMGREWNNNASFAYTYQYQKVSNYDQFSKNLTTEKDVIYHYNQEYEFIDIKEEKNQLENWNNELSLENNNEQQGKIYRIFSKKEEDKIKAAINEPNIFKKLRQLKEILKPISNRFKQLPKLLEQKYKFNLSSEITNLLLKNQDFFFELLKSIAKSNNTEKSFNFDEIKKLITTFSRFQKLYNNQKDAKTELTINYVAYNPDTDLLLNSYSYNSAFNKNRYNNMFLASMNKNIYGIEEKKYNKLANWKNKEKYGKLLFDISNEKEKEIIKTKTLPVLISSLLNKHPLAKYKIGDIIPIDNFYGLKNFKIKIAGILEDYTSDFAIITNQKFIEPFFKYRECQNGKIYEKNEKNEWNIIKTSSDLQEELKCQKNSNEKPNATINKFKSQKKYNLMMSTKDLPLLRSLSTYFNGESINILSKKEFDEINKKEDKERKELKDIDDTLDLTKKVPLNLTFDKNEIKINSLIKDGVQSLINTLQDSLIILRYATLLVLGIVLLLLIFMIIDDNLPILVTMKILGYKTREIVSLIVGWYLLSFVLFFSAGIGFSYLVWNLISMHIFKKIDIFYPSHLSGTSLAIIITLTLTIVIIAYIISKIIINRKSLLLLEKTST